MSIGRSLEKAVGNSIGFCSSLVMFVAAHYAQTDLTFPKIFSTLEIITNFKQSISTFSRGISFYYEVRVVFERFASIFNIENASMIEIDPVTLQPINKLDDKGHE